MRPYHAALPLLICLLGCRASQSKVLDDGTSIGTGGSVVATTIDTIDDLRGLIQQSGVKTIDALVASLPADYRSSFTLMASSRSLQDASWTNPRAILFGKNANLVMTFNGSPEQKGYAELEVMQFNKADLAFEFYRVGFPENITNGTVSFSNKNPTECLACHQTSPRPNWEPYFNWPGAFGAEDDGSLDGSDDQRRVQDFVKNYAQQPRYRQLLNVADHYALASLTTPSRLEPGKTLANYAQSPNQALMALLFKQNVQRIGKILVTQPAFANNKYFIASALSGCFNGFSATDSNPNMPVTEFTQLYQLDPHLSQTSTLLASADDSLFPQNYQLFGAAGMLKVYNSLYKMGLKISLSQWATSFFGANDSGLGGLASAPFNDGSSGSDVSQYITAAALSHLDTDFAGLDSFLCPVGLAPLNGQQVSGQQFCPDLSSRQQELTTKYAFFESDGHRMVCRILAQKWLRSLGH